MRRLVTPLKARKGENSLARWMQARHPLRVVYNYLLIQLSRYAPSLALKRVLLRLTGMKVGTGVSVAQHAWFDFFFPDKITLQDHCVIGFHATILAHEFLVEELRVGDTVIGAHAMVGANATVLAGVKVGEGAQVGAMSLVSKDVADNATVVGVPARPMGGKK